MSSSLQDRLAQVFKTSSIIYPENPDMNLMEVGVDSVLFLRLIVNIEVEFDIIIPDGDLTFENFQTISVIMNYLENSPEGINQVV